MKLPAFSFPLQWPTNFIEDRILEGARRALNKDQNFLEMGTKSLRRPWICASTTKSVTVKVTKSVVLTELVTDEEQHSVIPW